METSCSVQCWKLPEAGILLLIQVTGEHLRRFVLFYVIQGSIDLLILNMAMKLRRRTSLIAFDSYHRLDATFPQSSKS
jgi:hypothetical protein